MDKIAVMGEYDSIYGFASLGLTIFPVSEETSNEDAAKMLHRLAGSSYGVIYITEGLAARIGKEVSAYDSQVKPAIILIPGVRANTGAGVDRVKKTVEQAVGSDILFGNQG